MTDCSERTRYMRRRSSAIRAPIDLSPSNSSESIRSQRKTSKPRVRETASSCYPSTHTHPAQHSQVCSSAHTKKNRLTNQYTLARILATAISFFCGSKHIFEFLHLADEALIPSCTRLKKKKKKFPPPATRLPRAGNSESHDVPGSWP